MLWWTAKLDFYDNLYDANLLHILKGQIHQYDLNLERSTGFAYKTIFSNLESILEDFNASKVIWDFSISGRIQRNKSFGLSSFKL